MSSTVVPSGTSLNRGRRRLLPLLVLGLVLSGLLLGGCARVRTALAVQPDDRVTGEIVVATPQRSPDDKGATVTLPADLAPEVDISSYKQDGYAGSVLRFSRLRFDQISALTGAIAPAGNKAQLVMKRAGGRLLVTGSVDLTTVSVDKADFQLKISFPGTVVQTNGEVDGTTISWTFTPGEVGTVDATVAYADPNAPSPLNWTLGLAGVVVLAAAVVVLLARRTRNPPVARPGRS
ncbi:LppM family (lipo)protein [Pseudonocardia sp. GCM10023141]|uniref:LppM family (lipo)protein n=1 Tax=Pseudonocardia sp. GCM10023141 TaxID=3252653 RepID=UPI00360D429C